MTPPAQKNARGAGLGDDRGHVAALFAAEMERLADDNRRLYEHIGRIAHNAWMADEAERDREKADEFRRQFERAARADEEARAEAERLRRQERARRAAREAEEERLREEHRKRTEAAAEAARERARQAAAEAERFRREEEERMRRQKEEREARERARQAEEERRRREAEERARRERAEREARERAEAERLRREEEERRRQEQAQKEAREREARRRAAEAERARREEERQRAASALENYDRTWRSIAVGGILEPLTFAKFPWPMATAPSCHHEQEFPAADIERFLLSTLQTNAEKCKAIRKELTRWHPDKINLRVLFQIASDDTWRVKAAAVCITRVLIGLLEKFNKA